jgi:hypothetical protein
LKQDRFYLASLRDTVGGNMAFHAVGGRGYVTDVSKAHLFDLVAAQRAWDTGREFDLPVSANDIDRATVFHVDCQHISSATLIQADCERYVAFVPGRWDGNDVYWVQVDGEPTTDFSKARIFQPSEVHAGLVFIPFDSAQRVKRPTFALALLNRRKSVLGAGLLTPDHVKRAQRKKSGSGKTRFNCPSCGRLSWQFNPDEFEGCNVCGFR